MYQRIFIVIVVTGSIIKQKNDIQTGKSVC